MTMLRLLIADDERPARERLKRLLATYANITLVGEATDGRDALEKIAALKPDAVFLDIDMPELNGLEVAAALGPTAPAIVFCTAYDQYAVKAFELSAVDYVLKPVEAPRLDAAIGRLQKIAGEHLPPISVTQLLAKLGGQAKLNRLALRCGGKFLVCNVAEVSAIVAKDHYAEVVWGTRQILADDPLEALAARVDPSMFMRIHRSAMINLSFLKELRREGDRKYVAVLGDDLATELPVSREKLPDLKAALGIAD